MFGDTARLLLTLLYQRQVCSMNMLADLLEVTATCIGDLLRETREVLEDHGHDTGVAPVRFATADALLDFLDSDHRPARTAVIERLSHPALTGLTQHQLQELTSRLAMRQSAQAERLSYQRRDGPRQPGTRGGVFHQKISNSERVLLTLLYHRGLCTLDVLADTLGGVSRSAVGNVIRETLPLLQQEGGIPSPRRRATAQRQISSLPEKPTPARRQVDSLRLHFLRNVLAQVPKGSAEMVAATIRTIFAQPSPAQVREQLGVIAAMLGHQFPKVETMLHEAADDITAFAAFPAGHWKKIWSTNPLERLNKEIKRRTDVVGVFPNPEALLRLAGSVLVETHDEWQAGERRYRRGMPVRERR